MKRFVIVGGGTAGWMAASTLSRLFAINPEAGATVTLIESEEIGTVGVGEATIPTILDFVAFLKADLAEFMRATDATFKLAIRFQGWREIGHSYWHPFGSLGPSIENRPLFSYWLARHGAGANVGGLQDLSIAAQLAERDRFAFPTADPASPLGGLKYALHFDAAKVARFLRNYSEAKGVKRIEGKIIEVEKSAPDRIASVVLSDGQRIQGDFFMDCSGFKGLLIDEALGSAYEDWSAWLPCDSAIAVPTANVGPTKPYTIATARSAGWTWRIPLQSRTGNGYVYSSRFISDDAARAEFLASLGGEPIAEPRLLRFTGGMRREIWRGNCLALGLASGFLEPLESTSIHLVFINLFRFLDHFPGSTLDPALIGRFNRLAAEEIEEIRDFLILHYFPSHRRDSDFWRHVSAMELPETLRTKIDLFREQGRILTQPLDLFTNLSWVSVLHGMAIEPQSFDPLSQLVPAAFSEKLIAQVKSQITTTANAAPSHDDFLERAGLLALS
jgi:tryptophan 7-halogenase